VPISVDYSMTNGTAAGGDYTAGNGKAELAAGAPRRRSQVPITDDLLDELMNPYGKSRQSLERDDRRRRGRGHDRGQRTRAVAFDRRRGRWNETAGDGDFTVTLNVVQWVAGQRGLHGQWNSPGGGLPAQGTGKAEFAEGVHEDRRSTLRSPTTCSMS